MAKQLRAHKIGNVGETNADVLVLRVSGNEEMEAFDALGPLTRLAIETSPIKILAAAILAQVRNLQITNPWMDPKHAMIDERLAMAVRAMGRQVLTADRDERDVVLGMTPIKKVSHYESARHRLKGYRRG